MQGVEEATKRERQTEVSPERKKGAGGPRMRPREKQGIQERHSAPEDDPLMRKRMTQMRGMSAYGERVTHREGEVEEEKLNEGKRHPPSGSRGMEDEGREKASQTGCWNKRDRGGNLEGERLGATEEEIPIWGGGEQEVNKGRPEDMNLENPR